MSETVKAMLSILVVMIIITMIEIYVAEKHDSETAKEIMTGVTMIIAIVAIATITIRHIEN